MQHDITAVSAVVVLRLITEAKEAEMYGVEESKHTKYTYPFLSEIYIFK